MKLGLFIPCYIDAFFPEVGVATLELLERVGCAVEYPLEQTCCGQPMANSGCQEDAAATEAHFVHCFQEFDAVIGPSGSCVHHVRYHLDAISAKMGYDRVHDFNRHGAEYIVSADMSCLLHMKGVIDRLKLPMKVGGELHVVLVDNTRSDRLGSADFWHALKCIRCGACMNTCPVYRRGGGLSYGATYSGPIGVILDPGFDLSKYRELPFHSSLCGSCTEVCPVKIDISDQIYKWRRVVAAKGMLKLSKTVGMSALGTTLAHPAVFHPAESAGESALEHLPRFLLYNPLNPWGRHRELPAVPRQTFRQWYLENRRKS